MTNNTQNSSTATSKQSEHDAEQGNPRPNDAGDTKARADRDSSDNQGTKPFEQFRDKSPGESVKELETDPQQGLSADEAKQRFEKHGPNALQEDKESPLLRFVKHFWGPIPWMIEIACILALIAQRWEDFFVILVMLVINGGVSYWHERKAGNAIDALKKKLAPDARVVRGGQEQTIPAKKLVPGDIAIVRMGDVVPSDAQLLDDQTLSVDESSLTGESLPVDKAAGDIIFSGTSAKRGEAKVVIIATGSQTRFAGTVELVETAEESSHFRRAVLRIGHFLIIATAVLVCIIAGVSFFRGDPWTTVLMFALGLTLAGIPAALPAVLSVTMTVGAQRLASMKAIVAKLSAMEEMAGLEVLCADKTGTLTRNELEIQDPVALKADDPQEIILAAALTTQRDRDDPIDNAILAALEKDTNLDDYEREDFKPFDPTRKRAEATVKHGQEEFSVAKGAPQVILDLVEADDDERSKVTDKVDELGEQGFRCLGVARRQNGQQWSYLGLLPLLDPPRDDTADVIKDATAYGIDVRMVTGDHAAIARQVAQQVGLGDEVRVASNLFPGDGEEKQQDGSSDKAEAQRDVLDADAFAEVTPEHKFNIIKQFQAGDRIIGMTGDGVNDAPALKQADVGIAVSDATDAARSAAALVLTEPGLGVIVHAVEEARRIFERMVSYATFRIAETMRVLLFISISTLVFNEYPVTPIMIVLLAILNDIPIMTIAWDNAPTSAKPVRWDMKRVLGIATILGVTGVVSSFLLYWFVRAQLQIPLAETQTMVFLKLLVAGHMTIYLTRKTDWMWKKPWPSIKLLLALETTQVVGTLFAVFGWIIHPIPIRYALGIWAYAVAWVIVLDAVKVASYRLMGIESRSAQERQAQQQLQAA